MPQRMSALWIVGHLFVAFSRWRSPSLLSLLSSPDFVCRCQPWFSALVSLLRGLRCVRLWSGHRHSRTKSPWRVLLWLTLFFDQVLCFFSHKMLQSYPTFSSPYVVRLRGSWKRVLVGIVQMGKDMLWACLVSSFAVGGLGIFLVDVSTTVEFGWWCNNDSRVGKGISMGFWLATGRCCGSSCLVSWGIVVRTVRVFGLFGEFWCCTNWPLGVVKNLNILGKFGPVRRDMNWFQWCLILFGVGFIPNPVY